MNLNNFDINTKRISVSQVARNEGADSVNELLETYGVDSVVPACCEEGCFVEPDGECPHGNPSFLLVLGMI